MPVSRWERFTPWDSKRKIFLFTEERGWCHVCYISKFIFVCNDAYWHYCLGNQSQDKKI